VYAWSLTARTRLVQYMLQVGLSDCTAISTACDITAHYAASALWDVTYWLDGRVQFEDLTDDALRVASDMQAGYVWYLPKSDLIVCNRHFGRRAWHHPAVTAAAHAKPLPRTHDISSMRDLEARGMNIPRDSLGVVGRQTVCKVDFSATATRTWTLTAYSRLSAYLSQVGLSNRDEPEDAPCVLTEFTHAAIWEVTRWLDGRADVSDLSPAATKLAHLTNCGCVWYSPSLQRIVVNEAASQRFWLHPISLLMVAVVATWADEDTRRARLAVQGLPVTPGLFESTVSHTRGAESPPQCVEAEDLTLTLFDGLNDGMGEPMTAAPSGFMTLSFINRSVRYAAELLTVNS
jgi:hypothetical protein